ncbi:unnamed protein product, partial [Laminaria digitata]
GSSGRRSRDDALSIPEVKGVIGAFSRLLDTATDTRRREREQNASGVTPPPTPPGGTVPDVDATSQGSAPETLEAGRKHVGVSTGSSDRLTG